MLGAAALLALELSATVGRVKSTTAPVAGPLPPFFAVTVYVSVVPALATAGALTTTSGRGKVVPNWSR